jgi:hypothetical protein
MNSLFRLPAEPRTLDLAGSFFIVNEITGAFAFVLKGAAFAFP